MHSKRPNCFASEYSLLSRCGTSRIQANYQMLMQQQQKYDGPDMIGHFISRDLIATLHSG